MKLNITHSHFKDILNSGYSLDVLFFIKLVNDGWDAKELCEDQKMSILCQGARRKGLLSENFKLTILGQNALSFLESDEKQPEKIVRKKSSENNDDFEKWWKAFPGTDTFIHKNVRFYGSRSLRQNKEECKNKFNKIISEGEYSIDDLIDALLFDILQKKENSVKTKSNKLSYMQNSLTYLNQRSFEPFIELIKEGIKINEEQIVNNGGVDV